MSFEILQGNCNEILGKLNKAIDFSFLDPPFNRQKEYACCNDNLPTDEYWNMMQEICSLIFGLTKQGGCIYFMQREKNAEDVLRILRHSGWTFQNLIIWKKRTSAVPVKGKYGKQYQIIVYATKGERAKTFHRLRINPELPANYKFKRDNGVFVTDVWEDIRELTSGYFAGDEALRTVAGDRFHKQQSPLALLLRMILTSTNVGDTVLDPFAGTGTTSVVALQTQRNSVSIELDPNNIECINSRLASFRNADIIQKYYSDYIYTDNLADIWGDDLEMPDNFIGKQELKLFGQIN